MKNYLEMFDNCVYAFDGEYSILHTSHIGICSDIASLLTPDTSVNALKGFQAMPYSNSALDYEVRIDGERIKCDSWKWLPNAILRCGHTRNFDVKSLTALVPGSRTIVQKITVHNKIDRELEMPVVVMYRGKTVKEKSWTFDVPLPAPLGREIYGCTNNILSLVSSGYAFRITSSLPGMRMFGRAYLWENDITVPKGESATFYFSIHIGDKNASLEEAENALNNYETLVEKSFDYLGREIKRIENQLPRLKSDCPELDRLYYRSLVTYILCRWDNPELCIQPFFSTGSVNGSCMCSYLWDYCGGLMMHPIYDEEGNKNQLKAFMRNDLTNSYAVNPVTGGPVGPWYMVNQEKIILMVYHHVLATGDKDFLHERVGERTVIEWMRYSAYVCDDVSKEVELYNYGVNGNVHLELSSWNNGPYNGIIPDLNARRYMNYMRVYELTKVAGTPDEELPKRAAALAEKMKTLWNEDARWYDFIDVDENRDIRYTIQMFKFINSGVIGKHERDGLVSHINEKEFLSKFGIHSLSKLDNQYDQDDIDNGGGGTCTHFAMQICAQLYEMGYDEVATDILRRVYWWGERLAYLGDSCAANMILGRDNTPLQGDISSVSCAQMIFFFIFGITAHFDGSVTISPVKHRPAENMKVENAKLCNKVFSVDITGDKFTVECDGEVYTADIGETITL